MKRFLLCTLVALAAATATADAAAIDVRIEGQASTLFEGRIATNGRNVQSLSERATGAIRRCDGTNNSPSSAVVPTGTASTADALSILGKGFDGQWYDEYEDYLVSRLGDETRSWRLFRNEGFTTVGGCQLKLSEGEGVLWAGTGGPLLALTQNGPTLTTSPDADIYVAGADGSQGQVLGKANGAGQFTPSLPGGSWYRLKATKAGMVRSARVDYCPSACPAKPADMQVRIPPPPVFYGPGGSIIPGSSALARLLTPVRISRPVVGTSGYRRGRIAVRWRVTQEGVGLLRWTIASDDLTTRSKRYVTRARGTTGTSASLSLPAGRVHALRFNSTDRLSRRDSTDFGRVLVPVDDRAKAVKRSRGWRKLRSSKAWKGTVLRGRRGARLEVKLAAGRPALLLRGRGSATVRIAGRSVRVPAGPRGGRRVVVGGRRKKAGSVTVTVSRGSIDLDGVAASP